MRRRLRIALVALVGLPVLVLLVLLLYLRFADLGAYHVTVERLVSEALGRRLTIAGRFEPRLGLRSTLVAEDLALANPGWCQAPAMIRVERLSFELDLWSLVSGPIRVRDVSIEGARVSLETGPDGRGNWLFDLPPPKDAERPPREAPAIVFESASLRRLRLDYRSAGKEPPLALLVRELSLGTGGEGMQEIEAEGELEDLPYRLEGRLGPLEAISLGRGIEHDLRATLGEIALTLRGTLGELPTLDRSELHAEVEGPEIETLTELLRAPSLGEGPFRAAGEVSTSSRGAALSLEASAGGMEIRASGRAGALLDPRVAELEVSAHVPDLGALGDLLGVTDLPRLPLDAAGKVSREDERVRFDGLELMLGENRLAVEGVLGARRGLPGTDLRVEGKGPDLAVFGVAVGKELPPGAYELSGHVLRVEEGVEARELRLRAGGFSLLAEGVVGDPPGFSGTNVHFRGEGPDLSLLSALSGIDLPAEAFVAEGGLEHGEGGLGLRGVQARLGEATLFLDGTLEPVEGLVGTDLRLRVAGPDLARVASLAGGQDLPHEPFEVEGRLGVEAGGYLFEGVRAALGELELDAEGRLGALPGALGTDLQVQLRGPRLSRAGELAGYTGLPADRFRIAGRLRVLEAGYELESVEASVGDLSGTLAGRVGPLPGLEGTRVRISARGARLPALRAFHEAIPALPETEFEVSGDLGYDGTGLDLEGVTVRLGANRAAGSARLAPLPSLAASEASLRLAGPDLARAGALAREAGLALDRELPALPFEIAGRVALLPGRVEIEDLRLGLEGARARVDGVLGFPPGLEGSDLVLEVSGPDGSLVGGIAGVELPSEPFSLRGRIGRRETGVLFRETALELGEYRLELEGSLGEPPRLAGTDLDLLARGPNLRLLGRFVDLPPLPERAFELRAHIDGDPEAFSLRDLSARFGESDLRGNLRVDLRGRPELEAELRSECFNLTPWIGGPEEETDEEGSEAQSEAEDGQPPEREEPPPTEKGKERLIPDEPLELGFLEALDGELRWTVGEILNRERPLKDFELKASLEHGTLRVDPIRAVGPFGGDFRAHFLLEPVAAGHRLGLRVEGRDLPLLLTGVDEPQLRPVARLELQLRATGRSAREMALSAEAWGALATGAGRMNNKGLDLLGMDLLNEIFMTLNPFAKEDPYTHVECMVLAVIVRDGVARLAPLALRTSKTTLAGQGRIRFENEELDLSWTAKPRKGTGLMSTTAITNPFLKVSGTLSNPRLDVEPLRAATATGAAVATAGLSLLAKGMWDRATSGKNVCKKAEETLLEWIEEHEEIESSVFVRE